MGPGKLHVWLGNKGAGGGGGGEEVRDATRVQLPLGKLESEVRGKLYAAVSSQYQQEPQPGAPDYLILPTRPRLDTLGLIPCFWLEAKKLPHLLRAFCCQHLSLVFCSSGSSDFLVPRYCLAPLMAYLPVICFLVVSDHQNQTSDNVGMDQYSLDYGIIDLERTRSQKIAPKDPQV